MKWTEEREAVVIQLWNMTSASLIADRLGVSRNAIIGKAHRLGLAGKPKNMPQKKKPSTKRTNVVNRSRIKDLSNTSPVVAVDLATEPVPIGRTFMSLEPGECKWPIGTLFCGAPAGKAVYCPYHSGIAYVVQRSRSQASPQDRKVREARGAAAS